MNKETASEIYSLSLSAIKNLTMILNVLSDDMSTDEVNIIKNGLGRAIGDIQIDLLEVITAKYPEMNDLVD